jgi:hypothetical protein
MLIQTTKQNLKLERSISHKQVFSILHAAIDAILSYTRHSLQYLDRHITRLSQTPPSQPNPPISTSKTDTTFSKQQGNQIKVQGQPMQQGFAKYNISSRNGQIARYTKHLAKTVHYPSSPKIVQSIGVQNKKLEVSSKVRA